jgi:hypothetical protein
MSQGPTVNVPERLLTACSSALDEVRDRVLAEPQGEVVFVHAGPMSHDEVALLTAEAERYALAREEGVALRKRLLSVLVEGLENVHHHALAVDGRAAFAILMRSQAGYRFAFGNGTHMVTALKLAQRVEVLNEMDEVDLKEHYLKLLALDARSEHGGAGLGLLTLARRAERPMVARVIPVGADLAFFGLELVVPAGA